MEQAIAAFPRSRRRRCAVTSMGRRASRRTAAIILGEAPECRNFFVAAGFNSIGIASGAGAGKAVAEWIVGGEPPMDLWDVDIRRVAPFQANPAYLRARTVEMVGLLYAMHWPFQQPATARGVRRARCTTASPRAAPASASHGLGARQLVRGAGRGARLRY